MFCIGLKQQSTPDSRRQLVQHRTYDLAVLMTRMWQLYPSEAAGRGLKVNGNCTRVTASGVFNGVNGRRRIIPRNREESTVSCSCLVQNDTLQIVALSL